MLNPQLAQHVETFEEHLNDGDDEGGNPDESKAKAASSHDGRSVAPVEEPAMSSKTASSSLWWCSPNKYLLPMLLGPCIAVLAALPLLPRGRPLFWNLVSVGGVVALLLLVVSSYASINPFETAWKALVVDPTSRTAAKPISQTTAAAADVADRTATVQSRVRISQWIGSIGAPLLLASSSNRDAGLPTKSARQIQKMEEMAKAHVEWLQTFDRIMLVLRHTASVKLGLGSHSQSVGRVERAWVARTTTRTGNNGRHSSAPVASVSLARVRELVYQTMDNLNHLLLQVTAAGLATDSSYAPLSDNSTDHVGVVTLSLLQSMRLDSVELVSTVLDELYFSDEKEEVVVENRMLRMEEFCQTAREACAYFSSWLDCSSTTVVSSQNSSHSIRHEMYKVHQELEVLHSMLAGCQEMLSCQHESASVDKKQFQLYWRDLKYRVVSLHELVDAVDCCLAADAGGTNAAENTQGTVDLEHNTMLSTGANGTSHTGEYISGEPLSVTRCDRTRSRAASDKVLVYTGKGSVVPAERKLSKAKERSINSDPPVLSANVEYELMEELNRHLRSMSQAEEMVATSSDKRVGHDPEFLESSSVHEGYESEDNDGQLDPHHSMDLPSRQGENANSFLAELSKSIPALAPPSEESAECYEIAG